MHTVGLHQWSFRKTVTMQTLGSQAEIGVLVQAQRGSGGITREKSLILYTQTPAIKCIFGGPKRFNNGNGVPPRSSLKWPLMVYTFEYATPVLNHSERCLYFTDDPLYKPRRVLRPVRRPVSPSRTKCHKILLRHPFYGKNSNISFFLVLHKERYTWRRTPHNWSVSWRLFLQNESLACHCERDVDHNRKGRCGRIGGNAA